MEDIARACDSNSNKNAKIARMSIMQVKVRNDQRRIWEGQYIITRYPAKYNMQKAYGVSLIREIPGPVALADDVGTGTECRPCHSFTLLYSDDERRPESCRTLSGNGYIDCILSRSSAWLFDVSAETNIEGTASGLPNG